MGNTSEDEADETYVSEGLVKLRAYLLERFKSARKAFQAIDAKGNGTATYSEMVEAWDRLQVPWREITGQDKLKYVFKGHPKAAIGASFTMKELLGREDNDDSCDDSEGGDLCYIEKGYTEINDVLAFAQWAAVDNKWEYFDKLFYQDAKYQHLGLVQRREVSFKEFQETCRSLRYSGDSRVIFREIQNECLTMRERVNRKKQGVCDTIFARQFRQFERKSRLLIGHLDPERDGSPVTRLAEVLRKLRGSVLRAWRLDMDIHCTGKVAYTDFVRARCALSFHGQLKQAWKCLRPNRTDPIEFHELAEAEASNLERFSEALWNLCGFDVDEAWAIFDVNRQNFVSRKQFVAAAASIGFDGDAQMIFHGLSTPGCGRLWKSEFAYITKVSSAASRMLSQSTHLVHALITWVHAKLGSSEALISKLGLTPSNPTINVSELAARLTAMGYTGDSLWIASRAARLEGGTFISAESLHLLLTGARRTVQTPGQAGPVVWARPKTPKAKRAWENSVSDIGRSNVGTPRCLRSYFSSPTREEGAGPFCPLPRTASTGALQERRPTLLGPAGQRYRKSIIQNRWKAFDDGQKPVWDGGLYPLSQSNTSKSTPMKFYFNDFSDRPVRDKMMREIEEKRMRASQQRAASIRATFTGLADSGMDAGDRVLLSIKAMFDERKMTVVSLFRDLETDGSRDLYPEELADKLGQLGLELTAPELEGLMLSVDRDGGGTISVKEMCRAMRAADQKLGALDRLPLEV